MCINCYAKPKSDVIGYLSFGFFVTSSCVIISSSFYGAKHGTVSFFSMANIPLRTWATSLCVVL